MLRQFCEAKAEIREKNKKLKECDTLWTDHLERRLVSTLSRVCESLERGERRLRREDVCTSNRVAWQYVSLVVDRLLLVTFTVGTIAVTIGVLLLPLFLLSFYCFFILPVFNVLLLPQL